MDRVWRWVLGVAILALAGGAVVTVLEPPGAVDIDVVSVLVALTVALIAAATLPLRLPSPPGEPITLVTIEDAVLLAMLVTAPLGVVPWLVMLGTLLHQVRARTDVRKLTFNVGLAGVGAATAVAVVLALDGIVGDDLLPRLGAAAAGATASSIVALVGLAGLYGRLDNRGLRAHLEVGGFLDIALGLNLVVGLLLASAVAADPLLAWLDVVAVAVLGLVLRDLSGQAPTRGGPAAATASAGERAG